MIASTRNTRRRGTSRRPAQPTVTTPAETHIEAQLRHKLKEKDDEIERLQKRMKGLMVAEKKGLLERTEFAAERERHVMDLDDWRQRATRLQMDTEAAESRAAIAEQKLDRAERLGEKALAESRSTLTLSTAAPMSSYATLPARGGPCHSQPRVNVEDVAYLKQGEG